MRKIRFADYILPVLFLLTVLIFYIISINSPITKSTSKIRIAVLDTGVDYYHPVLEDSFIKDKGGTIVGKNFADLHMDFLDRDGHGTHISGIIKSMAGESIEIIPVKVVGHNREGTSKALKDGIEWAIKQNVSIIVISLGTPFHEKEIAQAIYTAWNKGILIVSSVGNTGSNSVVYPAGNLYVLGVGSVKNSDYTSEKDVSLSPISNIGEHVSIVAPGDDILSCMPTYQVFLNEFGYEANYSKMTGTSQACAYAAGMISEYWYKNPTLTNQDIYRTVLSTAASDVSNGWEEDKGYGLIDITNQYKWKKEKLVGGVYGQLISKSWEPISGAEVSLAARKVTIKNDGTFRIPNISPGKYSYKVLVDNIILIEGDVEVEKGSDTLLLIKG